MSVFIVIKNSCFVIVDNGIAKDCGGMSSMKRLCVMVLCVDTDTSKP